MGCKYHSGALRLHQLKAVRIIPLGTSSGVPTKRRNVTSFIVSPGRQWFLFDCGEGTQYRLMSARVRLSKLAAIFITHLHGDHLFGLPGLLSSLSLKGRSQQLMVFGPRGIEEFVRTTLRVAETHLPFELKISEIAAGGALFNNTEASVDCGPLDHRVQAFGYRVLKRSDGRSAVFCTDTKPSEATVELARGADLLIHEATYTEDLALKAHERGHSTAADAARVARQAEVRQLMLTHYSPRYDKVDALLAEARAIFPETIAAADLVEHEIMRFSSEDHRESA